MRMPIRSTILAAFAAAILGVVAAPARAVIVADMDEMDAPANSFIGAWNGSSCVAVGPHHFLSAKHVGGVVGQNVVMKGVPYRVVEILLHTLYDVQLLRVAEDLPGYHHFADNPGYGDPCLLGGFGVTTTGPLANNAGWNWDGTRRETWGANMIEGDGSMLAIRFDAPSSGIAVPHEATFAVNDSGAGLFTIGADGSLELAGIAVSVMGFGSSQYNYAAFALNVSLYKMWAQPIVDPAMPISSGVAPPRAMLVVPGAPEWLGGALTFAVLAGMRRRKP